MGWTWKSSPELMKRLQEVQNKYPHVDIMTYAGMCDSEAELEKHVKRYEKLVKEREEKRIQDRALARWRAAIRK